MQAADVIKALASERRLQILDWLKDPSRHFPRQTDGDLVEDGVCALLIAAKLGITQATLSEHMRVLVQAGLVEPKRIKQWTFYRRNEVEIAVIKTKLLANL
jgi:ArsR family transcriptional regulator